MNKNAIKKNVIISFCGQLLVIMMGFLIPKIMISRYGSDVNGLLGTITQVCAYMALLEAGITTASRNELLKPISENDRQGVCNALSISQRYFRGITWIYAFCVVAFSIILPFILKSNVDKVIIFWAVLLEGFSGVIGFYYIETFSTLLSVDGRSYVNNAVNTSIKLLVYFTKLTLANYGLPIIILQLVTFIITIGKVVVYRWYINKYYSWVLLENIPNELKLKDRNAYVITEIAGTISSSTDLIVLSVFIGTTYSSVYSVYNMIFANLSVMLNAVYFSVIYIVGQAYHKDLKEYQRLHDLFTSIFVGGITILVSTACLVCIPFLKIYTRGFSDQNYILNSYPVMFSIVQLLSWSRYVAGNLTGISGYAKKTSYVSMAEAAINVSVSIALVKRLGINGVLLGSIISVLVKVVWCIYVADNKVMKRSYGKSAMILGGNYLLFAMSIMVRRHYEFECSGYGQLLWVGVACFSAVAILGVVINCIINPECVTVLKMLLKRKRVNN